MCKSDNTQCTDGHKNKNNNLNNCLNSKCCYNNNDDRLDDSDLNYDATLSDPETERYYYKLDSLSDSNMSSVSSKMITPTPTPATTTTATAPTNTHKEGSRTKLASHTCRMHCKYSSHNISSSNKCKYRVVYRQPKIDFSQMVLVPFDPSAWNGPVLKPRTALNSEELKLLDTPKTSVSSRINGGVGAGSTSSNNTLIQDENIQRREDNKMMTCGVSGGTEGGQTLFPPKDQNSVSDSDDGCTGYKQNSKCVNNETARLRKTPHPKNVIGKLFSLVKPTTHRRNNDQNATTNTEQAIGWQNGTDNLEANLSRGHLMNTLAKDKTIKDTVICNQNHYSRTQNNVVVVHQDNSGNNLIKPQSNLSNDIHFSTNNKTIITPINSHVEMSSSSSPPSSSHPSCYAKLHERLDPPIHIYDTAHNIQANINDSGNDCGKNPCSPPPDEQINVDVRYSSQMFKLFPEKDVNKTLSIEGVMNEKDTVKLSTSTAAAAATVTTIVTATTTTTTTTKYADLTFLPNSSTLKTNILLSSCIPSSVTGNAIDQKTTTTTRINRTGKDSMSSTNQHHEQESQQLHRFNQPYFNSLSKSTVNRLYDIEISSCSTAYESVMEFVPNCDDNASKPKTTREVYEDAEALYRHLSDLKQQHHQQQLNSSNSDIQTTPDSSTPSLHQQEQHHP
ncbi:unnamed protein product [Trichobilharzia regenti]|nr:unnamed protein product [Trichobilharzia regenti]